MAKGSSKSKSMANLKPWPKGTSGNPAGTSKTVRQFHDAIKAAMVQELQSPSEFDPEKRTTKLQAIIRALVSKAQGGDIPAIREMFDRLVGRPQQAVSIETENTALQQAFERMNRDELTAYAETGMLPKWFETESASGQPIQ